MVPKTAVMDASSAIILCRADLHMLVCELYDIVLPLTVYREITVHPYAGAGEFKRLAAENRIRVLDRALIEEKHGIQGLDAGETDVIALYLAGGGDFVITDDGRAARYCRQEKIPFINALLFPVILRCAGLHDDESCRLAMARIVAGGRYSRDVILFARECGRQSIAFALP
jgi:predicted nucleic acid-binding protein